MEAVARSPVYALLSTSLNGAVTIRSRGIRSITYFRTSFEDLQTAHMEVYFNFVIISRWLCFRLDLLAWLVLVLTLCGAFTVNMKIDVSLIGLSLTYAINLVGNLQWTTRQSAEVQSQMTAVERIDEYSHLVPESEPVTLHLPDPSWPTFGAVCFNNVTVRYVIDGSPILDNITCIIHAGEKIGVCGRTGAGKSTLIAALFRMAHIEGNITIDGIDASFISLETLRGNISVIPQDPLLFSGSLRTNLDPFQRSTDMAMLVFFVVVV